MCVCVTFETQGDCSSMPRLQDCSSHLSRVAVSAPCLWTSASQRRDVRRVRGVDGRRPLPLPDLHQGLPRRLPAGAGLPACRSPAGDARHGPQRHRLELLLLCESAHPPQYVVLLCFCLFFLPQPPFNQCVWAMNVFSVLDTADMLQFFPVAMTGTAAKRGKVTKLSEKSTQIKY